MTKGNFGLWYNKFIPVKTGDDQKDHFKACDDSGKVAEVVGFYQKRYDQMKRSSAELLRKKHDEQASYCDSFPKSNYEVITLHATLISPLITGIGESHPHEVSMVFDHNLGIPYIPASGVKGIVRFAHTLSIVDEAKKRNPQVEKTGKFDDEEEWTLIPLMFGKQDRRGSVIFLDAYPEKVPDLHIDIMNPHYGDYYDPRKQAPPADYLSPNPLKFLTVAQGTVFVFRAIARKESDIQQKVKEALSRALTEEGVGAKTAVGYGRFDINEKTQQVEISVKKVEKIEPSLLEKYCQKFNNIKPNDAGRIGSLIDEVLKALTSDEDKKAFARHVKEFMGKEFRGSKAREKLKTLLG